MSITLTTPKAVSINGVQQENDTQGAAVSLNMDWMSNVGTVRFSIGSGAPSAFNIGVYDSPITLVVNMTSGAWTATNGQGAQVGSGTFSGAGFTNFQSQFKSLRNSAESFAAANLTGLLGTQVAWT